MAFIEPPGRRKSRFSDAAEISVPFSSATRAFVLQDCIRVKTRDLLEPGVTGVGKILLNIHDQALRLDWLVNSSGDAVLIP